MKFAERCLAGILMLGVFCFSLAGISEAGFLQAQRAQLSVFIQVTVIPGPLGADFSRSRSVGFDFGARDKAAKGSSSGFDAPIPGIVVAATQGATAVQANVLANPTGNLLTASVSSIAMTQGRGTTQTYSCPFSISVNTTVTSWTLDSGLTNDFTAGFPGNDLAYNIYVGAPPSPENYTAYVVYPNNNNTWAIATTGSLSKTYCVDLQLTIPAGVPLGTYSTNAVYTLFY